MDGSFWNKKTDVQTLSIELERMVNEIDQIVFEMYGLSKNEINILEDAIA